MARLYVTLAMLVAGCVQEESYLSERECMNYQRIAFAAGVDAKHPMNMGELETLEEFVLVQGLAVQVPPRNVFHIAQAQVYAEEGKAWRDKQNEVFVHFDGRSLPEGYMRRIAEKIKKMDRDHD